MKLPSFSLAAAAIMAFPMFDVGASEKDFFTDKPTPKLDTCIVVVEPNEHALDKKKQILEKVGVQPTQKYRLVFDGMALPVPCDRLANALSDEDKKGLKLVDDAAVSAIKRGGGGKNTNDGTTNTVPQQTPWHITSIGGSRDGSGLTAWIIDTGIDLNNADLNINTADGFSVFKKGRRYLMHDDNGHGTHVAGIVAAKDNNIDALGVAAGATVVPVKVLDANGSGTMSGVLAGVEHVAKYAQAGDCVNMSLGGGAYSLLDQAVINAANLSGAYFTLAAGNSGAHANFTSPARANGNNIYTISAVDRYQRRPSWSNYGNPPIDYAATGVGITSLKVGGGVITFSGTSMAAPTACGILLNTGGHPNHGGYVVNDVDGYPDPIMSH